MFQFSHRLSRKGIVLLSFTLIFLFSCKKSLSDEELSDRIIGTWESDLIVQGSLNFAPKTDSTMFYTNGKKNFLSINKRGFLNKNGVEIDVLAYSIEDGFLRITQKGTNDTLFQDIIFVNSKRLVLEEGERKYYYNRFVY